jgi:hypothetical protein
MWDERRSRAEWPLKNSRRGAENSAELWSARANNRYTRSCLEASEPTAVRRSRGDRSRARLVLNHVEALKKK